ncbi:MAG: phosphorylase [Denitromonas halophila]|nr:MAG: phosphorylase [Denitromonas halophila]
MTAPPAPLDLSLGAIDRRLGAAYACGALQPIETDQIQLNDHGVTFVVKWIARRDGQVHRHKPTRSATHNPFLPPEATLTLGAIGEHHLVLLNKYPVMARHLLIVTRDFEAQTRPITDDDFAALGAILAAHGGLGFYNAGERAGASQDHKHLQWIPDLPPLAQRVSEQPDDTVARFGFRHAFASLPSALWSSDGLGSGLGQCYRTLLTQLGIAPARADLPPYNLLMTREWMCVIPRSVERWQHMSINALGFAGSLFVKSRDQLQALTETGPLEVLRAVAEAQD